MRDARVRSSEDCIECLKELLIDRARAFSVSVFETSSGGFAVSYRASSREVPDLRSLQSYLHQMGVAT